MTFKLFQFHMVRLKESIIKKCFIDFDKFQFHKVRLKENKGYSRQRDEKCFNSTRYD